MVELEENIFILLDPEPYSKERWKNLINKKLFRWIWNIIISSTVVGIPSDVCPSFAKKEEEENIRDFT